MSKRAVLYARVSGDDTRNEGRNLQGQLEMCREYALKRGWLVVAELSEDDRGASGASLDLPQLKRLIEMARAGEYDVVIVREIDRFSRTLAKQLIVEEELRRSNVAIEYVLGEYPDTPEGGLNKNIKAVIAEYERLKTVERTTRGRRRSAASGNVLLHGDLAPFGYRPSDDKKSLVVHEAEAEIVRLVFQWYVEGDENGQRLGHRQIASRLTEMNVPSVMDQGTPRWKRRPVGEWAPTSVGYLLRNETYVGVWNYGRKSPRGLNPKTHWIPVEVPGIVSREVWERAQLQAQINKSLPKRNLKKEYLLQGHVRCGQCGSAVSPRTIASRGREYRYYRCGVRLKYVVGKTCDLPTFYADALDEAVWSWLISLLTDPDELRKTLDHYQTEQERLQLPIYERLQVVEKLISDQETARNRLLDLYLAGEFPVDLLAERRSQIEKAIRDLGTERTDLRKRVEQATLTSDQLKLIEEFGSQVSEGLQRAGESFAKRRRLVEALDTRVTLSLRNGAVQCTVECMIGETDLSAMNSNNSTTAPSISQRKPPPCTAQSKDPVRRCSAPASAWACHCARTGR